MKNILTAGVVMLSMMMFNSYAQADAAIGPGKKVTLNYTLTVDNKEVESSVGKTPLVYTVGQHQIIPGLENQLNGLHVNDEKTVNVPAKEAYGEVDPKAYKDFPLTSLPPGLTPKVGLVLQATAPDGSKFPAVISAVKGDTVTLNFNHPLAGKDLVFKVKILSIQ